MAGLDCNNFISDGRYQCQGEVLNSPPWYPGTGYGHFFVDVYYHADSWIVQVAHAVDHIGSYIRRCIGGAWQEWEKIATATPPQQFNLPLANGCGGSIRYSLDQFGVVRITGQITVPTNTTGITYIGTLPEGYRPSSYEVKSTCGWQTGGVNPAPCTCGADPDGRVWVNSYGATIDAAAIDIRFIKSLS